MKRKRDHLDPGTAEGARRIVEARSGATLESVAASPYVDIEQSEALVRIIAEASCDAEVAASVDTTFGRTSGSLAVRMESARLYGFVDRDPGRYALTELGRALLVPGTRGRAAARGFANPELNARIIDCFKAIVSERAKGDRGDTFYQAFVACGAKPGTIAEIRRVFVSSAKQARWLNTFMCLENPYGEEETEMATEQGEHGDEELPPGIMRDGSYAPDPAAPGLFEVHEPQEGTAGLNGHDHGAAARAGGAVADGVAVAPFGTLGAPGKDRTAGTETGHRTSMPAEGDGGTGSGDDDGPQRRGGGKRQSQSKAGALPAFTVERLVVVLQALVDGMTRRALAAAVAEKLDMKNVASADRLVNHASYYGMISYLGHKNDVLVRETKVGRDILSGDAETARAAKAAAMRNVSLFRILLADYRGPVAGPDEKDDTSLDRMIASHAVGANAVVGTRRVFAANAMAGGFLESWGSPLRDPPVAAAAPDRGAAGPAPEEAVAAASAPAPEEAGPVAAGGEIAPGPSAPPPADPLEKLWEGMKAAAPSCIHEPNFKVRWRLWQAAVAAVLDFVTWEPGAEAEAERRKGIFEE